jgi:hypothetical protein
MDSLCFSRSLAAGLAISSLFSGACARDTADAGVKTIGVGFDPGELFPGPEPRGGILDGTLLQFKGTNLDLGVTGLFFSTGAFTDPLNDPFDAIASYGYLFAPALTTADEYQLVSPKGPDIPETCFVQVDARGPLGSFRTVDVGQSISLVTDPGDFELRSILDMRREPQDYPANTSDVFIVYSAVAPLFFGHEVVPDNWAFGENVTLHFDGGLPPEGAPVASIPLPSDAADARVDKEEGDPTIWSPDDLTGVAVSNNLDGSESVVMRYDPVGLSLPDPRGNDGVLHVTWDALPETPGDDETDVRPEGATVVTISIKLLGRSPGQRTEDGNYCDAAAVTAGEVHDADWLATHDASKGNWCDAGYEPATDVGNDEFGLDALGADSCHDGLDSDGDGTCDEGGCLDVDGVTWLVPDPDCRRHNYQTAVCGDDDLCRDVGGDRDPDGHAGDLVCTALDDGDFTVDAAQIQALLDRVPEDEVGGAVLVVSRTAEKLITVPMVRDQVGNQEDINPVRLRLSQVQFGRLAWE